MVGDGRFKIAVQPDFIPETGYKVYVANITQTGTSAPAATVLENTLGVTPTWARSSVGVYTLTATGAWVTNKTTLPDAKFSLMGEDDDWGFTSWARTSADVLTMETRTLVGAGTLVEMEVSEQGFTVTIKVYN
jgi:hypothetical protein